MNRRSFLSTLLAAPLALIGWTRRAPKSLVGYWRCITDREWTAREIEEHDRAAGIAPRYMRASMTTNADGRFTVKPQCSIHGEYFWDWEGEDLGGVEKPPGWERIGGTSSEGFGSIRLVNS